MTATTLPTHTTVCGVTVVWDAVAETVVPLTSCCKAAVTGTGDGLVCKGCYRMAAAYATLTSALIASRCPCPASCEAETVWQLELEAGIVPPIL